MASGPPRTVVIGVGNPFRRDDGVGAAVVGELATRLPGVLRSDLEIVALDGEPARIVDAWDGAELGVVVDAMRSRRELGAVRCVEIASDDTRALTGMQPRRQSSPVSGHGAGVEEAVALGSVLGRLPGRLVMYSIAGADFGNGLGLSPHVEAATHRVVDAIVDLALASSGRVG